jgi:hypothetical protein
MWQVYTRPTSASDFLNFGKFTLDLSEKKLLFHNMWQVYTRPTSASVFLMNVGVYFLSIFDLSKSMILLREQKINNNFWQIFLFSKKMNICYSRKNPLFRKFCLFQVNENNHQHDLLQIHIN